jgi:uncharacterized protein YjiS (DUF1127 family)
MSTLALEISHTIYNVQTFVIDCVHSIKTNYKKRRDMKRTRDELLSLSDRELNDMGIHRGQINFIVQAGADGVDWRKCL